ncbi:dromaiocalcin-1-like [Pundamilia nyererei]|uniref:Dromaiocalcin-1-like n=1 Tax=Pundamilia nyererei TaxID=303518 RepID=A0A9Y3S3M1_9CICH|nr:PREDICTED: dromaiocalcin-1-like [Pundamilia nyererei]
MAILRKTGGMIQTEVVRNTFSATGQWWQLKKKTWEEALKYCREHHNDLASVASETEMMLIQKELKKHNTTEHVWIGLRFLSREWLWVDKQEMGYEAWGDGGKPLCPHPKMKCGALQVTGGTQGVWEAHDCVERLNFICY